MRGSFLAQEGIIGMYCEERFEFERAITAYRIILYSKGRNPKGELLSNQESFHLNLLRG